MSGQSKDSRSAVSIFCQLQLGTVGFEELAELDGLSRTRHQKQKLGSPDDIGPVSLTHTWDSSEMSMNDGVEAIAV